MSKKEQKSCGEAGKPEAKSEPVTGAEPAVQVNPKTCAFSGNFDRFHTMIGTAFESWVKVVDEITGGLVKTIEAVPPDIRRMASVASSVALTAAAVRHAKRFKMNKHERAHYEAALMQILEKFDQDEEANCELSEPVKAESGKAEPAERAPVDMGAGSLPKEPS